MDKIKFLVENNIEVELFVKDEKQYVYISHDGSSGCEYQVKTFAEIGERIADYLRTNWDYL